MIVISDSSPLIALSRIGKLFVFRSLFDKIYIPDSVYQETVIQSNEFIQKENILTAIDEYIFVRRPKTNHSFTRTIDLGEKGVLNLAFDMNADILVIDEKKAGNEARELGFRVIKTSTLLRRAEKSNLITSYADTISELENILIYLPK